jgi:hypothetical protein
MVRPRGKDPHTSTFPKFNTFAIFAIFAIFKFFIRGHRT